MVNMKNAYHGFLFIRTFSIIALFFLFLNKKRSISVLTVNVLTEMLFLLFNIHVFSTQKQVKLFYHRLTGIKPFCRNLFHLGGIP